MASMASHQNNFFINCTRQQQLPLPQGQHQASWYSPTTSSRYNSSYHVHSTVDPPEDIIAIDDRHYYNYSTSDALHPPNSMDNSSNVVSASVSTLSIHPPDPPGWNHSFLGKRKDSTRPNYDCEDCGCDTSWTVPMSATKKSKVAPRPFLPTTLLNHPTTSTPLSASATTLTLPHTTQQTVPLKVHSGNVSSSAISQNEIFDKLEDIDDEVMSVENSSGSSSSSSSCNNNSSNNKNDNCDREEDQSDDNSIVSESSIRNAMYQLVFGRLSTHSMMGGGVGAGGGNNIVGNYKYDAVDSKIEDLIRRSRLKATIEGQKENEKKGSNCIGEGLKLMKSMSTSEMDTDDEDDLLDANNLGAKSVGCGDGERMRDAFGDSWTPGHG